MLIYYFRKYYCSDWSIPVNVGLSCRPIQAPSTSVDSSRGQPALHQREPSRTQHGGDQYIPASGWNDSAVERPQATVEVCEYIGMRLVGTAERYRDDICRHRQRLLSHWDQHVIPEPGCEALV